MGCLRLGLVVVVLLALGCSTTPASPTPTAVGDGGVGASGVSYHRDVRPILEAHCVGCHAPGAIAPFALTSFEAAKTWAEPMAAATEAKRMPPWGAQETSECKPPHAWKDDLRLSAAQIATLAAWRSAGMPEGRPEDFVSIGSAGKTTLEGAVDLRPAETFAPPAGADVLRCYELDPKLDAARFITGLHFVPSNKTIVHHALAFAVPKDAQVPASPYTCFGGPQVQGASLIGAWAPGGVPMELPASMGIPVTAGSRFIVQVHYHPHSNAAPEPDATTLQVRFADVTPDYFVVTRLIGNFRNLDNVGNGLLAGAMDTAGPEFRIPAGAEAHEERMKLTLQAGQPQFPNTRLLGVGAHMHLAGIDERISLEKKSGGETCLLQEPAWNFDWQRGYQYNTAFENLPSVESGDTLHLRCRYNNSLKNSKVSAALKERNLTSPIDIGLGEETLDEMCLGAFTFVFPRPL